MKQIRRGVFETNSSSTHSLTILTKQQFEDYKGNKLIFDRYGGELVDAKNKSADTDEYRFWTWTEFGDCYETYSQKFTTPSGDEMVVIGYYGYDG